jgi:predicted nucleic acid-binding protein
MLVEEEKSALAREVRTSFTKLIILDFLHVEIANALASATRQRRITAASAAASQKSLASILPITSAASEFLDVAFNLALEINHPVYDCLYAVAARENDATLITCDVRFAAKLDTTIYNVKLI